MARVHNFVLPNNSIPVTPLEQSACRGAARRSLLAIFEKYQDAEEYVFGAVSLA